MSRSVSTVDAEGSLTVAAVARRLGVAPATLRTWDRRYGIGPSDHDSGTHRRYSASDVTRLSAMVRLIVAGVAPKDAATKALELNLKGSQNKVERFIQKSEDQSDLVSLLFKSTLKFDQGKIEKIIRKSISEIGVEQTWIEVISPLLVFRFTEETFSSKSFFSGEII
jgi:DNA-binding transcriptional MerR regulator